MKSNSLKALLLILSTFFVSSCATIIGGSRYNARVQVTGGTNADILYNNRFVGRGFATIVNKRKDANKFSFVVSQKGCEDQTFSYNTRTFRGWAFVGTVVTFTSNTVYIPYGLVIDAIDGALWKPDVKNPTIVKQNYKNFEYVVKYTGCDNKVAEKLDVIYLKNGGKIKGKIIESDLKNQVKIETKDGSIFVYKFDEIEKVATEDN